MTLKLETISIDSLTLDPHNARLHDGRNINAIAGSLSRFGQRKPIVVSGNNVIVAGNGTVAAAKSLGWSEVQIVRVPADWTAEQITAYALADNRTAELAEWDFKILADQLLELDAVGWDISEFGFEPLNPVLNLDDDEPLSFDEVPSRVTLGELWSLGNHRLLCGDSTDEQSVSYLMGGELADLIFTDPPYGVNYDGGHAWTNYERREKLENDNKTNMYDAPIKHSFKFSKDNAALYLWFAATLATEVVKGLSEAGWVQRNWIIWNKNMAQFGAISAQYKAKHEPCIYAYKKGQKVNWVGPTNEVSVWDVKRNAKNSFHPTQKPVELALRAIGNHAVDKVMDLFGGSGSTLIACESLNKSCYMMELDPKYCDVIIDRWERATGKTAERIDSE